MSVLCFGWSPDTSWVHWLGPLSCDAMLTPVCAVTVQSTYVTVQNGRDVAVFSHMLGLGLPFFTRALSSLQVLLAA